MEEEEEGGEQIVVATMANAGWTSALDQTISKEEEMRRAELSFQWCWWYKRSESRAKKKKNTRKKRKEERKKEEESFSSPPSSPVQSNSGANDCKSLKLNLNQLLLWMRFFFISFHFVILFKKNINKTNKNIDGFRTPSCTLLRVVTV